MTSFDAIRRQANDLEIDVEIDADNSLNMQKRGATSPRFASVQAYDAPGVLKAAQTWLNDYRTFVKQADKARKQSAQYCRACHETHEADGICAYHDQQFKKLLHTLEKRTGKAR